MNRSGGCCNWKPSKIKVDDLKEVYCQQRYINALKRHSSERLLNFYLTQGVDRVATDDILSNLSNLICVCNVRLMLSVLVWIFWFCFSVSCLGFLNNVSDNTDCGPRSSVKIQCRSNAKRNCNWRQSC